MHFLTLLSKRHATFDNISCIYNQIQLNPLLRMNTENQEEKMNRLEFLKKMGLSGASLMAVYCGVTMTSCKNEDTAAVLTGGTAIYDMSTSSFSKLLTKGGYYVDSANNIVIANTSDNGYVAVTLICTHEQQRQVYYSTNKFACSAHGATFDNKGNATSVASRALATYRVTQTGNVLSVAI
jgi:cytochrome b6-f complex iron-sulfur subunit